MPWNNWNENPCLSYDNMISLISNPISRITSFLHYLVLVVPSIYLCDFKSPSWKFNWKWWRGIWNRNSARLWIYIVRSVINAKIKIYETWFNKGCSFIYLFSFIVLFANLDFILILMKRDDLSYLKKNYLKTTRCGKYPCSPW